MKNISPIKLVSGLFLILAGVLWISTQKSFPAPVVFWKKPQLQLQSLSPMPYISQPVGDRQQFLDKMTASSIYVFDVESGSTLLSKQPDLSSYPASTVKLMTALVAQQQYQGDDVFEVTREAFSTGNVAGLTMGDKFAVKDLIKAVLVSSGNDAAFVLADNHPLGYEGFVLNMNSLAQELKLKDSTFKNPSGLDAEGQLLTAHDLTVLARAVLNDPFLRRVVAFERTQISDVMGQNNYLLESTNELLGKKNVVGMKTGTTPLAEEALVTLVDREDSLVIITLLGSQDRFGETEQIIDWLESNLEWRELSLSFET